MADLLTDDQIEVALRDHLPSWKVVDGELVRIVTRDNFLDGIRLVATVAQLAESMNHHPDIDIRYTTITFRVSSHEAGGLTEDDLVLARHIDTAAG
ncbi:4a-hydroxytetrahydrobiopterin dehydratase [Kribbella aluminosa]|uniref:Putative pterin-4-alpha-carbinolamine dehydratase n=1 Tax=Kribbella aluminosa TaxID=416017 RepID=A0ABS4UFA4_9ACTN|nr:4a-hydroxytetrahydrobiopterin dehydratase [Kribbella aluminosa]MBP2350311.1 4a-hydroxytetrahydrobiopterin dehydratase [Kribbella aluminosa]